MFQNKKIAALQASLSDSEKRISELTEQVADSQNKFETYMSEQQIRTDSLVSSLVQIQKSPFEKKHEVQIPNGLTDQQKLVAAYALNLCTVSVSQIVDYNDIHILEQEYDAILNNLNLENIPKDEPLLKVLKQILDTITFFRIQEGDKKFIEMDYQQKMKNAIWKSVPNLSVILATGNPVAMAVSLASQVGIGYMNYRKEKAETNSEHEKQLWKLQRAAIEQFNALRRELFDTSWRLVDAYSIPDSYRLTETQISQYNEILMESDVYIKYERLQAIKDNFVAYPPFWYFKGHAANAIAQQRNQEKEVYESYKNIALQDFRQFQKSNDSCLLRTDLILASCCLEQADLLDPIKDRAEIIRLLEKAAQCSGTHNDVKQLCAIGFLKVGDWDNAKKYLRNLVAERFNSATNAQILSNIYCRDWLQGKDQNAYAQNLLLDHFVPSDYLYELPTINLLPPPSKSQKVEEVYDELSRSFIQRQIAILEKKYQLVFEKLSDIYSSKLNRLFQTPYFDKSYDDSYFVDSDKSNSRRYYDVENMLLNPRARKKYNTEISQYSVRGEYIVAFNNFINAIGRLNNIVHVSVDILRQSIESMFESMDRFESLAADGNVSRLNFDLVKQLSFRKILEEYREEFNDKVKDSLKLIASLSEISKFETDLCSLCSDEGISSPDELYQNELAKQNNSLSNLPLICDEELFPEDKIDRARRIEQTNICYQYAKPDAGLFLSTNAKFLVAGNGDIKRYETVKRPRLNYLDDKKNLSALFKNKQILAILTLGDKNIKNDLFFTVDSVYRYDSDGFIKIGYQSIKTDYDGDKILYTKDKWDKTLFDYSKVVNIPTLLCLFSELRQAVQE